MDGSVNAVMCQNKFTTSPHQCVRLLYRGFGSTRWSLFIISIIDMMLSQEEDIFSVTIDVPQGERLGLLLAGGVDCPIEIKT